MPHFTRSAHPEIPDLSTPLPLRARITAAYRVSEPDALARLLPQARMATPLAASAQQLAQQLAKGLRNRKSAGGRTGLVQGLLQEYALSSQEGVALMCLAEALLRIPDAATRDALIRDKVAHGDWQTHSGNSASVFVNAATWGLMLTGKLVATHSERSLSGTLARLIGKGGEPLIRKGVDLAMRMMGEQFVTGETIHQALDNARTLEAQGFRYSYDMLGEAALTQADAMAYRVAYENAIHAIGRAAAGRGVMGGPGISIKLSALHPRYGRAQHARVMAELYPTLLALAELARHYDIGLNIDAEEADRLELSLELLERLCFAPALSGWNGIGFVIQAYQKRCPFVVDYLIDLARRSQHRLMVRLVKGAYWDSEIKRAQLDGLVDFPVYTRKAYTDVSYLACAGKLLAAPDAIYPQFATHNAHTLAAIYQLADPSQWHPEQYEFQCLHGMGEPLYAQVVGAETTGQLGRPCRIYAPVGTHETLLAYLVRRLLENGANTSFVNRMADPSIPIDALIEDPVRTVEALAQAEGTLGLPHPHIAAPLALYGASRANARGIDLSDENQLQRLREIAEAGMHQSWSAGPMVAGVARPGSCVPVRNPADANDVVGAVQDATVSEVGQAVQAAIAFAPEWANSPAAQRAQALEAAADALEADMPRWLCLLSREAGKTMSNGIAEVREAVDFLRYYAAQIRATWDAPDRVCAHVPLGPVVCISPWNFPLAIFVGQVAAALAAGNPVLAKPAEQTPLIAAEAVRVLWQAGIPKGALQLLPGRGETVGAALVADAGVQGVLFTGSTEVARLLQRNLAGRVGWHGGAIPLVAETGGQNAMVVDSSALLEQVTVDVLASAFDSAGQRCSALRVLCVQEDVADRLLELIKGAMAELRMGNPGLLEVDVGPVIDAEARDAIERHVSTLQAAGRRVYRQVRAADHALEQGTFVPPTLIEIDGLHELQREVFGPVLHVVRWPREGLDAMLQQINQTGYGLTLGVHTRIDETIERVVSQARAGNVYVNRNMVGAVVGVQPFGGEGLSGTGPKAGGPLYLYRLLAERPPAALARALDAVGLPVGPMPNSSAAAMELATNPPTDLALDALRAWAAARQDTRKVQACHDSAAVVPAVRTRCLVSATGERNTYRWVPREAVLCLSDQVDAQWLQLCSVLAAGSRVVWPATPHNEALLAQLPVDVRARIALAADWTHSAVHFDLVLYQGDTDSLRRVQQTLAARPGPIVSVRAGTVPWESLWVERALSVNTAAAGGNASLMTMG